MHVFCSHTPSSVGIKKENILFLLIECILCGGVIMVYKLVAGGIQVGCGSVQVNGDIQVSDEGV